MPVDPQHLVIGDPAAAAVQAQADNGRRIDALERTPTVQVGSGAPSNTCRDGTLYVDVPGLKLYVRVGGAWKSTTLS